MMKRNISMLLVLSVILLGFCLGIFPSYITEQLLVVIGIIATIPVVIHIVKTIIRKKITVDLLASVALRIFMIKGEWVLVAFINLMITSARIFGNIKKKGWHIISLQIFPTYEFDCPFRRQHFERVIG